ncbi:hypothetical protein F5Y19DRAFT_62258 [Xylariaceae sp. FL1651]|nr:hypothetical protein F5Y19DRAFT_62258 [Xylariaceae sp. FL1651]
MNWTEGCLARHSRGRQRNALLARQKQHFAKAGSNLLNRHTKQGPVTISFLEPELSSSLNHQDASPRAQYGRLSNPLLPVKRELKRERPTSLHDYHDTVQTANISKRSRLLEKSDWAGLKLQKPLEITFPGQLYATKRWGKVTHPPGGTSKKLQVYKTAHKEEHSRHFKKPFMKIQIGGQEIQPSVATRSQLSIRRYSLESERSTNTRHQILASECSPSVNSTSKSIRYKSVNLSPRDTLREIPTSTTRSETPTHVVYSPSAIYEPAPRRADDFRVLQWSPSTSEDRGSMQVEIDRPARPVPPSQEPEQQKWKDWIMSNDSPNLLINSPLATKDSDEIPLRNPTSSATLPSHLQLRLPNLDLYSETCQSSRHNSPDSTDTKNAIEDQPQLQEIQHHSQINEQPMTEQQRTYKQKSKITEDLNDIWMKFAHGDDDDSERLLKDAFKGAAHQAAIELRPSDPSASSENVHNYTDIATACSTELSGDNRGSNDLTSSVFSSESHVATQGTTVSGSVSSNIATMGSLDKPLGHTARFTMPKAFIGKRASMDQDAIVRGFTTRIHGGKRSNRRREKQGAMDGRTDIRGLPDFDGDPIEEIEDN